MKSLMLLWVKIAEESAIRCGTCTIDDIRTCRRRAESEGLSFLAITLPNLGKVFERSLDQGQWATPSCTGFHLDRGLPRFLGGFLELVFARGTGVLLSDPNVDAIIAIRQLTLMFGKTHLLCSDARVRGAMTGYVECEQDVHNADSERTALDWAKFRRVSSLLFGRTLTAVDRKIYGGEAIPKHGPGATADGLRGNAKYRQVAWPARLDKEFPIVEFLLPSPSYYKSLDEIDILELEAEVPVKVISVPKTMKTPRVIGIEPTAMQYAQQAVLPVLLEGIRSNHTLDSFLGFDDQVPNQELAKEGSLFGELATLDLSEASDRVSNRLVVEIFRNHPHLQNAVAACRSTKADVPGHGILPLAKFASMGSALCFPCEAMAFLVMVFIGIEESLNTQLTPAILEKFRGRVRIYGDDIIVPAECVEAVVTSLGSFGAVVGMHKSFWTGRFRESCGKEYWNGHDVSLVKVRKLFPTHRRDAEEIIALVSLRNQLYWAGYWATCQWLDDKIRAVLKYFPVVESTSPCLGRESVLGYVSEKDHPSLFSPMVRGWTVSTKIPKDPLEDVGALLKVFLMQGRKKETRNITSEELAKARRNRWSDDLFPVVADETHLERFGRSKAVYIKLAWNSPF